jgi:tetratricopeptide (TPR) repeat protein
MRTSAGARFWLAATAALLSAPALADSLAQKYYYEDITQPFFAPDPARPGWYRSQRPASIESSFPAVKAPGTFRVFVLGGSIAELLHAGNGRGEFGRSLAAVLPSLKVETLNCGMAGYDSYREALVEQEILEFQPDLIVLLTGHNEGLASAPVPIWIMRAQERLGSLAAYRALVAKLHPAEAAPPEQTEARADARDAAFAKNLGENIRHARERGAAVAVVVPPRNYREPSESGLMLYDAGFVPGWILFLKGDYAGARSSWKSALEPSPKGGVETAARKAFTWGFIARAEEKLGLADEARASFDEAARFDREAICGAVCQEILRRVSKEDGAFLVEADRMFRELALPRAPGLETFNDRMHWKPRFNCLMSSEIIASLRADPALAALPWDAARASALKASCARPGGPGDEQDDLDILNYILMALSWPGFHRLSTVSVFSLEHLRRSRPKWFADVPALLSKRPKKSHDRVYGLTRASAETVLPRLYWHIGEADLMERDYAAASADFKRALELDPSLGWARLSLAVSETLRGDERRGSELLKAAAARAAGPERDDLRASAAAASRALGFQEDAAVASSSAAAVSDPESLVREAEAAAAAGRADAGLAALGRALALSPQPHQLLRVSQCYRRFGRRAKVFELSDALVKAYPADADVWLMRAESAFATGRKDAGRDALARAEGLNPGPAQRRLIESWRAWIKAGSPAAALPI